MSSFFICDSVTLMMKDEVTFLHLLCQIVILSPKDKIPLLYVCMFLTKSVISIYKFYARVIYLHSTESRV